MAGMSGKGGGLGETGSMLGIGIQLVVTILAFAALGWWLDKTFSTEPWLLLVGLLFGATGGMISFIRTALNAGSSKSKRDTKKRVEEAATKRAGQDG